MFIDTSRRDELGLTIEATIPGLRAKANLGFLQLDVSDNRSSSSRLKGGFLVDLKDPNRDGPLTLSELRASRRKPGRLIDARFDIVGDTDAQKRANSRMSLDFVTSFEGDARFPELSGRFEIGFNPASRDGSSLFDFRPEVTIADVRFNPGQVIREFAGPLLDKVAEVLAPMKPLTDFVTAPLPLISELSGSPVTVGQELRIRPRATIDR